MTMRACGVAACLVLAGGALGGEPAKPDQGDSGTTVLGLVTSGTSMMVEVDGVVVALLPSQQAGSVEVVVAGHAGEPAHSTQSIGAMALAIYDHARGEVHLLAMASKDVSDGASDAVTNQLPELPEEGNATPTTTAQTSGRRQPRSCSPSSQFSTTQCGTTFILGPGSAECIAYVCRTDYADGSFCSWSTATCENNCGTFDWSWRVCLNLSNGEYCNDGSISDEDVAICRNPN